MSIRSDCRRGEAIHGEPVAAAAAAAAVREHKCGANGATFESTAALRSKSSGNKRVKLVCCGGAINLPVTSLHPAALNFEGRSGGVS